MWMGSFEDLKKCPFLTDEVKNLLIDFIKNNDMQKLSNGRYDLDKENYVNVFEYETKETDGVFEMHKQYIDIHYAITGEEKIFWGEKYMQETKPYQVDGDYSLGTLDNPTEEKSHGKIFVFLPDEPHKAGVMVSRAIKVKKAVFKVRC